MTRENDTAEELPWTRYVAIGDSFTEGLWGEPADDGSPTGWADLLAAELSTRRAAAGQAPLEYANLAVRGRLLRPILTEQLPEALALQPDLVSIIGGGNDLLRPGANVDVLARNLEAAVARARARGADVLLATGMDAKDSPLVRRTRPRVGMFNAHIWSIARRHGAFVLDVWGMRSLRDWRMWAPDRIHLNVPGHARVAQAAIAALGLDPEPGWDEALPDAPVMTWFETARWNAEWTRDWAIPWATRRLRRRSSGDARVAKRPDALPLEAPPQPLSPPYSGQGT